jgi:hypothetical protein
MKVLMLYALGAESDSVISLERCITSEERALRRLVIGVGISVGRVSSAILITSPLIIGGTHAFGQLLLK